MPSRAGGNGSGEAPSGSGAGAERNDGLYLARTRRTTEGEPRYGLDQKPVALYSYPMSYPNQAAQP